ncbi:MAG TPA: undecaprenyldiphospho-muramoylpentapeptide beta-N-acetylglucosaminyltransferase [Bacteroidota bacterium]|nr:undecaprenyldiphospho-muramoylpentapeptide beta-N-acetylglucosaminyltransferase [Bacteroidota bacterium]
MPADCYVFAGGGTGGHLYPALAIAGEIRKASPGARICFIGTKGKIESRVVPAEGYEFRTLWISGLQRRLSLKNLLVPLKAGVSMIRARAYLRELAPRAVVGTGGYVSGPVVMAATMMGIPTLIHEQNSVPGETTRMLAPRVSEVHVSFEETMKRLPAGTKVFLSGNPTRSALSGVDRAAAVKYFDMDPAGDGKVVLVSGGSLGAVSVNDAVLANLDSISGMRLRIIWQTGAHDAERIGTAVSKYPRNRIWTGAFIDNMGYAYAAADAVVCRAGATTIAELTRLGKPAILVPYPRAAAGHQTLNARSMESCGAALVVADAEAPARLGELLSMMMDDAKLASMSRASASLGRPEAARVIAGRVMALNRQV